MYLSDYHTHSACSPDGRDTAAALAGAGVEAGLAELAVTDHYDLDDEYGNEGTLDYDAAAVRERLNEAERLYGDRIRIRWGIELGEAAHAPERAEKALSACPFDFVIGSLHNLRGSPDFYLLDYRDEKENLRRFELYLDELIGLARLGGFDVLGHLGYPLRYMAENGAEPVDFRCYEEKLRALFKLLICGGRGIEINTSGLRGKLKDTMPPLWCLRLYRECGGEIVTVGSDAHRARHVGAGVREGYAMLAASGFSHVAGFEKRKPVFHRL